MSAVPERLQMLLACKASAIIHATLLQQTSPGDAQTPWARPVNIPAEWGAASADHGSAWQHLDCQSLLSLMPIHQILAARPRGARRGVRSQPESCNHLAESVPELMTGVNELHLPETPSMRMPGYCGGFQRQETDSRKGYLNHDHPISPLGRNMGHCFCEALLPEELQGVWIDVGALCECCLRRGTRPARR